MPTSYTDLSSIKEHPVYQLADKVLEICTPLFNNFSISHFGYSRKYHKNNGMIRLESDKKQLCYSLQSTFPYTYFSKNTNNVFLPKFLPKKVNDMLSFFNCYNGFGISKTNMEFFETIEFHAPNAYSFPLEFYTNKELLNKFILYFKDKARGIIEILEHDPLYLPGNRFIELENPNQSWIDFCQAIKIKKLPLKLKNQEVHLSHREFDILSLLIKGKTMRKIAQILKISPRTVETYLYTAKDKTNAFTVNQLLESFVDSLF